MEIHHKVPDCEQATCVPEVVRWWEKYEVTKKWFDFKIFEWINTQIGGRPCGENHLKRKMAAEDSEDDNPQKTKAKCVWFQFM